MIVVKVSTNHGDEEIQLPDHDGFEVNELNQTLIATKSDDQHALMAFNARFWVHVRLDRGEE